jgi:hypothetical protein
LRRSAARFSQSYPQKMCKNFRLKCCKCYFLRHFAGVYRRFDVPKNFTPADRYKAVLSNPLVLAKEDTCSPKMIAWNFAKQFVFSLRVRPKTEEIMLLLKPDANQPKCSKPVNEFSACRTGRERVPAPDEKLKPARVIASICLRRASTSQAA